MKTGIRTEIVVSISLLLGAALLFAGFLLVKLTEQELLDQQRAHSRASVALLLGFLDSSALPMSAPTSQAFAARALSALQDQAGIIGWRLFDERLREVSSLITDPDRAFMNPPPALIPDEGIRESVVYSSGWLPWQKQASSYLDLTAPVQGADGLHGVLQIRFSLNGLVERVHRAQRLVSIYVVLYGLILAIFGVYLLNRNVVQPIRHLQRATADVSSGSMQDVEVGRGPKEITDLATSFNQMVAALKRSKQETEDHISSLLKANQDLARARDDLIRSEKMASVGQLAAGMAHEIGNPLGALVGYLGVLHKDLERPGDQELVGRATEQAERIDKLVRELLDYAAPGRQQAVSFSPVEGLRETVSMLAHQGSLETVQVEDHCRETEAKVLMDPGRLQQVWVNLLLNARDAVSGQGTIRLGPSTDADWVGITVADDGPGIAGQDLEKIFEPFFTTKNPGKGRGLGLAVCQRIINEAGGRIEAVSQPEHGSVFTVWLPRVQEDQ